jgi:hypothetical protein
MTQHHCISGSCICAVRHVARAAHTAEGDSQSQEVQHWHSWAGGSFRTLLRCPLPACAMLPCWWLIAAFL